MTFYISLRTYAKDCLDIYKDKIIITGHTPTVLLTGDKNSPILEVEKPCKRFFLDGCSKIGEKGRINLLKLSDEGQVIWKKYLTREGVFEY